MGTMERDLLRLSQLLPPLLMPRLRLTRGTDTMDTDMVLDTMDTVLGTMVASTVTTATTARDLLRLSLLLPLLLKPRLIPICSTEDTTATVLDIMAMAMATPMDMSTESKSNARTEENDLPNVLNFREESKDKTFFKQTAFKHLYILDLLRPLEPQVRTKMCDFSIRHCIHSIQ